MGEISLADAERWQGEPEAREEKCSTGKRNLGALKIP